MLVLAACKPQAAAVPAAETPLPGQLQIYSSPTPSSTPAPQDTAQPTATLLPSPTPTPRIHTVEVGEDLGGIAYRYQVSLTDLINANPGVNPSILSVGTNLIVPPSVSSGGEPTATPTPAGLTLSAAQCAHSQEGGVWCWVMVRSETADLENVAAEIRISGTDGQGLRSGLATSPLNLLRAGMEMPLVVYFAPPVPEPLVFSAELAAALPVQDAGQRYLPAVPDAPQVAVAEDGLTAQVSGRVVLEGERNASVLWVQAVAYNQAGQTVGFRRWESPAGLQAGEAAAYQMVVYSMKGKIARVEVSAEARP